jgi:hypothetical protein
MKTVFALVDCNNFYASCEKLFRPDLRDTPVIVLSNKSEQLMVVMDEINRKSRTTLRIASAHPETCIFSQFSSPLEVGAGLSAFKESDVAK